MHGLNRNIEELMQIAPESAKIPCAHGYLPWMGAVLKGYVHTFKFFVSKYPDIVSKDPNMYDAYGGGPLNSAIIDSGDVDTLQASIEYGFNINYQNKRATMSEGALQIVTACEQACETIGQPSDCQLWFANLEGMAPIMAASFFWKHWCHAGSDGS